MAGTAIYYNAVAQNHIETDSSIRRGWQLHRWNGGGVLASEMGLGKTSVAVGLVYLDVVDPARSTGRVLQSEQIAAQLNAPVAQALFKAAGRGEIVGFAQSQEQQEESRRHAMARYLGLPAPTSNAELAMKRAVWFGEVDDMRMPKHPRGFGSHYVVDSDILSSVVAVPKSASCAHAEDSDGLEDLEDNMSECSVEFLLEEQGEVMDMREVCKRAEAVPKGAAMGRRGYATKSAQPGSASSSKAALDQSGEVQAKGSRWSNGTKLASSASIEVLDDSDDEQSSSAGVVRPQGWASTQPVQDRLVDRKGPVSVMQTTRRDNLI